MSAFTGREGAVFIGVNQIAEVTEFTLEQTAEEIEGTPMGAVAKVFYAGFKEASGSISMYYDPDDATGQESFDVQDTVDLEFYPNGNSSGKQMLSLTAIVTGLTTAVPKGDMVTREMSFRVSGDIVKSVVA